VVSLEAEVVRAKVKVLQWLEVRGRKSSLEVKYGLRPSGKMDDYTIVLEYMLARNKLPYARASFS
jgi:hypothetical protein